MVLPRRGNFPVSATHPSVYYALLLANPSNIEYGFWYQMGYKGDINSIQAETAKRITFLVRGSHDS